MKFSWNEMSPAQKKETIVLLVLAMIGFVLVILDLTGIWSNNLLYPVLTVLSLFEGVTSWNKNRKAAIMEFVCAAFFSVYTFL